MEVVLQEVEKSQFKLYQSYRLRLVIKPKLFFFYRFFCWVCAVRVVVSMMAMRPPSGGCCLQQSRQYIQIITIVT